MNLESKIFNISNYCNHHKIFDDLKIDTIFDFFNLDLNNIDIDISSLGLKVINDSKDNKIIKNSFISKTTFIGDYSLVRDSILFDGVHIGFGCEIVRSILLPDSYVPHHNFIGNSLMGHGTRIGGNVRTAIRRIDGNKLVVKHNKMSFPLNSVKAGAIIGDNCKVGSTVVFAPAASVGKNCIIEPLIMVSGIIPQNSYLKSNSKPAIYDL